MISISWQVDEKTKIFWQANWSGVETVLVNDVEVYRARSFRRKNDIDFVLADGSKANIKVRSVGPYPECSLFVNGNLIESKTSQAAYGPFFHYEASLLLDAEDHSKIREMMIVSCALLIIDWAYSFYINGLTRHSIFTYAFGIGLNILMISLAFKNKFRKDKISTRFWGLTRLCIPFLFVFQGSNLVSLILHQRYNFRLVIDLSAMATCFYYFPYQKKYSTKIKEIKRTGLMSRNP